MSSLTSYRVRNVANQSTNLCCKIGPHLVFNSVSVKLPLIWAKGYGKAKTKTSIQTKTCKISLFSTKQTQNIQCKSEMESNLYTSW